MRTSSRQSRFHNIKAGKHVVFPGILTMALHKGEAGWRVRSGLGGSVAGLGSREWYAAARKNRGLVYRQRDEN